MADDEQTPAGRVLDAAVAVARSAPERAGTNVFAAKVPWQYLAELRAALDALGIEWRRA